MYTKGLKGPEGAICALEGLREVGSMDLKQTQRPRDGDATEVEGSVGPEMKVSGNTGAKERSLRIQVTP